MDRIWREKKEIDFFKANVKITQKLKSSAIAVLSTLSHACNKMTISSSVIRTVFKNEWLSQYLCWKEASVATRWSPSLLTCLPHLSIVCSARPSNCSISASSTRWYATSQCSIGFVNLITDGMASPETGRFSFQIKARVNVRGDIIRRFFSLDNRLSVSGVKIIGQETRTHLSAHTHPPIYSFPLAFFFNLAKVHVSPRWWDYTHQWHCCGKKDERCLHMSNNKRILSNELFAKILLSCH